MDLSKKINDYFLDNEEIERLSDELSFLLTEVNDSVNIGNIQRVMRLNLLLSELKKEAPKATKHIGAVN